MKKKIKIILSAGLAIAICLSFIACSKSTVETTTEKQSVFSTESMSDTTATYYQATEESTYENFTEEETSEEYYHTAISGAVITEDDGDGYYSYKEKCEYCDYVSSSEQTLHSTFGTYSKIFKCPDCGNMNDVEIEANSR